MSELIILIDPNDANLQQLIHEVNITQPDNLWVGCSTSSGDMVKDVFERLTTPASLYPGNFDQIKKVYPLSKEVFISDPLFYSNPEVKPLFSEVLQFGNQHFYQKMKLMNYVLLHDNCTAARVLGVDQPFSNEEVIDALENTELHPTIYLEGGSRNQLHNALTRVNLIETIKNKHPEIRIIYGGGVSSSEDIRLLRDLEVDVLVSNYVHKEPALLESFMSLFL